MSSSKVVERSVATVRKLSRSPTNDQFQEDIAEDTPVETSLKRQSITQENDDWTSKAPLHLREPLLDSM